MSRYVRMEFISEHRNFDLPHELYNKQCKSMEEYLNENYDIDWVPILETAYLEYLDYQDELYEGLITSYPIDRVYNFFKSRNYNVELNDDKNLTSSITIKSHNKDFVFKKWKNMDIIVHIKNIIMNMIFM